MLSGQKTRPRKAINRAHPIAGYRCWSGKTRLKALQMLYGFVQIGWTIAACIMPLRRSIMEYIQRLCLNLLTL